MSSSSTHPQATGSTLVPADQPRQVDTPVPSNENPASGYGHPVPPPRQLERADEQALRGEQTKDTRSDDELRGDIARKRDELAKTLDALEYKLDVPARGRELVDQGKRQLARNWDDNPLLVAGIGAGALVAIAGAVAGIIALTRRGGDIPE